MGRPDGEETIGKVCVSEQGSLDTRTYSFTASFLYSLVVCGRASLSG